MINNNNSSDDQNLLLQPTPSDISFEEALRQLQEITRTLDNGAIDLDKSVLLYERGIELKKICERKLQAAQEKIEKINLSQEGNPVGVEPFFDSNPNVP